KATLAFTSGCTRPTRPDVGFCGMPGGPRVNSAQGAVRAAIAAEVQTLTTQPHMTIGELILALGYVLVTALWIGIVIYRKPLARRSVVRSRFWRNRPNAERVHEALLLASAALMLWVSVDGLYKMVVVFPRIDRELAELMDGIRKDLARLQPPASAKPNSTLPSSP